MTDASALAIAAAAPKTLVRTETCAKCKFSSAVRDMRQRQCRRFPPTLQLSPIMAQVQGRPPSVVGNAGGVSDFPTVPLDWWCGEFRPRVEGLS